MYQPKIDSEEVDFITRIYPNPVKDLLNLEITKPGRIQYQINGIEGKVVLRGILKDNSNKLDLQKFKPGVYILNLMDEENKQREQMKILKIKYLK